MTQEETIKVLQSIEDRATDFPYMTACDWVAISAAKRHLKNSINAKEVDLKKESLTWEDIRELYIIFAEVDVEIELSKVDIKSDTIGYYQEVLKRFKAQKGE